MDILVYLMAAIMAGVCGYWIFLIKSMLYSFRLTPYLDRFEDTSTESPRVSIILPARNEQEHIRQCLDSLVKQDYANYEIIVIDDSSVDATGEIISEYAKKHTNIVTVSARPKPDGWMGKNWACMEGYSEATGKLLLFTDADTRHAENIVSLAVSHLNSLGLDALSAIPRMKTLDFWTRITLPIISTFLHTRFSALKVNDPANKTGYFFGSFFIITRETYHKVGMHSGVRYEIIEDGALGKKVKESGYKMRMVRGEHLLSAIWARDGTTLWNALKRLMVPMYLQSKGVAVGILIAMAFLLSVPFVMLGASIIMPADTMSAKILYGISAASCVLVYIAAVIELRASLQLSVLYAIFAPVGGLVLISGFASGLVHAMRGMPVSWRGRRYSLNDHSQNSVGL